MWKKDLGVEEAISLGGVASLVIVVVEIRSASMLLWLVLLTSRDYPLCSLTWDLLKFFEMKLSTMRVFYGNLGYKQNCMCGLGDFTDSIF
jgi:hypothetical protein